MRMSALEKFFSKMHCAVCKCNLGLNINQTAFNVTVVSFTKDSHIKTCMLPSWLTKTLHQGFINLEIIILSEVSQTEKDKYHMIPLIHGIFKKDDTGEKRDAETNLKT